MSNARPNAAIHFQTADYDTGGERVLGRQSAGKGFLDGFMRHSGVDRFYCFSKSRPESQRFQERLNESSPSREAAGVQWIPHARPDLLREPGCLYHPDPTIAGAAWQRRHFDPSAYSVCGVTHTICSAAVMDAIGALATAPLHSWDAVVCTSQAAKATVTRVLDQWREYLAQHLQARPQVALQLPVIPLGVDCDALA